MQMETTNSGFIMYPAKLWTLASNIGIHFLSFLHGSGFVRWVIAPFSRECTKNHNEATKLQGEDEQFSGIHRCSFHFGRGKMGKTGTGGDLTFYFSEGVPSGKLT